MELTQEQKARMAEGRQRAREAKKLAQEALDMAPRTPESILGGIPESYRRRYDESYTGKAGLRGAIDSKCLECVCFESVVERIGGCTARTCPLWHYRPYKTVRFGTE